MHCDAVPRFRAELGDGNDLGLISHTLPAGLEVTLLGGDGRDELKTIDGQTRATLDGGADNDKLRSEGGSDVLNGGDGERDDVRDIERIQAYAAGTFVLGDGPAPGRSAASCSRARSRSATTSSTPATASPTRSAAASARTA